MAGQAEPVQYRYNQAYNKSVQCIVCEAAAGRHSLLSLFSLLTLFVLLCQRGSMESVAVLLR